MQACVRFWIRALSFPAPRGFIVKDCYISYWCIYLFAPIICLAYDLLGRYMCLTFFFNNVEYIWPMILIHINRRTQGIQISSISTPVKPCGLMGGTTPTGLYLSWQFCTQEWVLCKTTRENQSPICMRTSSWHWTAINSQ